MKRVRIAIGMGTYGRPKMLRKALESLIHLQVPENAELVLVVVDNDPTRGSLAIFDEYSPRIPFDTRYVAEEKRGIVPVRNRVLEESFKESCEFLAFFDDDETVNSQWLVELYKTLRNSDALAVAGHVEYQLPPACEGWLKERDFYGMKYYKTGERVFSASTNNVFFSLDFARQKGLSFNEELNDSGSSDTHFFTEFRRKGGKIVWSNEAITYESIPLTKANRRWILLRAFKTGFNTHHRNRISFGTTSANLTTPFHALVYFFKWLLLNLRNGRWKKSNQVFNDRALWTAKGYLHALLGRSLKSYRMIHGH